MLKWVFCSPISAFPARVAAAASAAFTIAFAPPGMPTSNRGGQKVLKDYFLHAAPAQGCLLRHSPEGGCDGCGPHASGTHAQRGEDCAAEHLCNPRTHTSPANVLFDTMGAHKGGGALECRLVSRKLQESFKKASRTLQEIFLEVFLQFSCSFLAVFLQFSCSFLAVFLQFFRSFLEVFMKFS